MSKPHSYDFIATGAGSAGCALAPRLALMSQFVWWRAVVTDSILFITMPAGNGFIFDSLKFDWDFESVPQHGLDGRRIYYPRGKGLGGSSNLNGMIYIRPSAHPTVTKAITVTMDRLKYR